MVYQELLMIKKKTIIKKGVHQALHRLRPVPRSVIDMIAAYNSQVIARGTKKRKTKKRQTKHKKKPRKKSKTNKRTN